MSEASDHQISPSVDERSRVAVRTGDREPSTLTLSTPRERAAYAAGRRVRLLYTMLLVVAATAAGAWFAGTRIQSPAEMAARVAPPAPSPILVPVEEKILSADVVTRGTARFGLPQPISLAPSPLKPGPGVITTLPVRNTQLQEGDVVLTASGRPVFILQGKVPAYRDLVPELAGEDVRQLKQALSRLGFDPGDPDTPYSPQTGDAVAKWYKSKGWEPFGPNREQIAAARAVERDLADAIRAKAAGGGGGPARATAAHSVKAATVDNAARAGVPARVGGDATGNNASVLESER